MSLLLAVDPGLRYPAAAVFKDGILVGSSRVKLPTSIAKLGVVDRTAEIADLILDWALDVTGTNIPDELVVEFPQVYRAGKSKGDPNDLMPLGALCGALAGRLRGLRFPDKVVISSPLPREWIGNAIKKATSGDPLLAPRGRLVWSRLSELERDSIVVSHDSLDAVGVGLWRLGRLLVSNVLRS